MENKKWYDNAVMLNHDADWYRAIDGSSADACKESMEKYFSRYGGNVTDVMLNLFSQTSVVPSKKFMWLGEKYLKKIENGIAVDYTGDKSITALYKCYAEYGVDPAQIFIDQVTKLGIRPWITIRMNDAHYGTDETSYIHSDMFYEEVAAGHNIGEQYGYYKNVFDFKYPRYRTALLEYIKELLGKYDVFGFEVDFMREIYCFNYKDDTGIQKIMLDYMHEIRKAVDEAALRVGHGIKVSIRTNRDPDAAYEFGFDIKAMVEEGLVDIVIPSPRWSPTDSGIPIAKWRELLGDKVGIIAGIEANSVRGTGNMPVNSKAYAAAFYAQGADGIYYNNHQYYSERSREAWLINRDTCMTGRREFVVTYQDNFAYEEKRYKPLPLTVDGSAELPLEVGKIKAADKVTLVIDFESGGVPTVSVLGKTASGSVCEPVIKGSPSGELNLTDHCPIAYDLPGISTDCHFPLLFNGNGTVHYVNIIIEAN